MQPDIENDESEMEMLLNEIPHLTPPHYHHHRHQRRLPRALPWPSPSPFPHDMHGHGDDSDDVTKLAVRLQSIHIGKQSIDPFGLERNLGALARNSVMVAENPNLGGLSPFSIRSKNHGFDPFWDSNALNLQPPTRSPSPVDGFRSTRGPVDGGFYGYLHDSSLTGRSMSLVGLAKDRNGCRFLQRMVEHDVDSVFYDVIGHVGVLMMDPVGNYLIQKLFEACSSEQTTTILLVLTEDPTAIFRISLDCHGTRAMQKLIETLKTHQQIALFMAALRPRLHDLMKDVNGSYVIQYCLTCLRTEDIKFIFDAATKHCVELATHRHGCYILQRCIGCSTGELRADLVAKVSSIGLKLAVDANGNYLVQYIIGLKCPPANASLAHQFEGKFIQLSMQKFSSNVVEKCLREFGNDFKAKIVHELLSMPHFEQLLQHPFANYVIQSALLNTKGASYSALVEAIRLHAAVLRTSPYCKRIFSLLPKKYGTH